MARYVVLHHQFPAGHAKASHWDLMLEWEGVLRTWSLAEVPRAGGSYQAQQLDDHRMAYLDYEGPVSGDRGWVTRVQGGVYEVESASDDRLAVILAGEGPGVRLVLERLGAGHSWRVSLGAADSST